jgi:hypothetical protein
VLLPGVGIITADCCNGVNKCDEPAFVSFVGVEVHVELPEFSFFGLFK